MTFYRSDELLAMTNSAELICFLAEEMGIEFTKPKKVQVDDIALEFVGCRSVEDREIIEAIKKYCARKGFEVHFPGKDCDCWLYQGILHKGPAILLTVSNHSNKGMGSTSIIHLTASLK